MDYAILGDTYSDVKINYLTQGVNVSGKAAKLNGDTKKPTMINNWINRRPNVNVASATPTQHAGAIVNEIASSQNSYDDVLARLGLTVTGYNRFCNVNGYRKLKTAPKVPNASKKVYEATKPVEVEVKEETIKPQEIVKMEEPKEVVMKEEPVAPMVTPSFEMPKEEVRMDPTYQAMPEVTDTRSSRYERIDNNVINTPERFQERPVNNGSLNEAVHTPVNTFSRVERNDYQEEADSRTPKVQVGKSEQDLNMISEKIHGNDGISAETSQIKEETFKMIQGTNQLNARNEELAEERKAIIEKIKEVNALKAERVKMANQKAKEAYKIAQKDNDEATHVYRDLTEQLKVLKAQLREAESSLSEDDEIDARGMRMAA